MASTHFSGPVVSSGGFTGDVTGDVTGAVTGAITGDVTGNVTGYVTKVAGASTNNTTGVAISAALDFVTITSGGANNISILPAPVVGKVLRGMVTANGCEIRSSAPASIAVNGVTGATVEAALAANSSFEATCLSSTKWILLNFSTTGEVTSPVPD